MPKILIVVPCYNESKRFDSERFSQLSKSQIPVLFVNDGSKDETLKVLERFCAQNPSASVLNLPKNGGKAEAVRQGLLQGINSNYDVVGFVDADLATPPDEILRLVEILKTKNEFKVFMGSRVKLLGVKIDRRPLRHYLGRIFATCASIVLSLPVYDTQCGAKFFRNSPALKSAVAVPFNSRWIFDVELISRLLRPPKNTDGLVQSQFLEVPLQEWKDVAGSKLSSMSMVKAFFDLLMIYFRRA